MKKISNYKKLSRDIVNRNQFFIWLKGGIIIIKYVVVQRYYGTGKVTAYITQMEEKDIIEHKEHKDYDLYMNAFETTEEAEKYCKECVEANVIN